MAKDSDPGDEAPKREDPPPFPLMPRDRNPSLKRRIADRLRGPAKTEPESVVRPAEPEGPIAEAPIAEEPEDERETVEDRSAPEVEDSADPTAEADIGPVHRATLRLLPGRLQPEDTEVVQQEVRFLRSAQPEQGVTLGWDEGEPPTHVTLDHPSLLPKHAHMLYRGREWWIESLSDRRPVFLNERTLSVADGLHRLQDGDRIRMGDARFVFRMT